MVLWKKVRFKYIYFFGICIPSEISRGVSVGYGLKIHRATTFHKSLSKGIFC